MASAQPAHRNGPGDPARRIRSRGFTFVLGVVILALIAGAVFGVIVHRKPLTPRGPLPALRHVFVINLENKDFSRTFGPTSAAPYLAHTLRAQGVLLTQYYGIGHQSNDNYLAQISGQGPNPQTQLDCPIFSNFIQVGTVPPGQALGTGCVYPASVRTVANQLADHGWTWKAYMEDMGNDPGREAARCGHPTINSRDGTQQAELGDQYATRHDPFVYFHSIIDTPACHSQVVPLSELPADLGSGATTPNLVYISPNLCDDGHDSPCVDGRPGGLATVDQWLATWVPRIVRSAAFGQDGMLVITFDESDGFQSDSSACCAEGPLPNALLPGILGLGGGRVGAVVLSRYVEPGSTSAVGYNHFSLLATVEDLFDLPRLGYAATASPFGLDVFGRFHPANRPPGHATTTLRPAS